ncbi:MAG: hypothetical protein WCC10_15460, partial [Tumebacillaceae bacterium]
NTSLPPAGQPKLTGVDSPMQNNQYTEILNAIFALRDNFEARFDALSQEVGSLKSDVSALKGDVSTLKDDVSTLKDDVSTLKGDVSTLKGDVSTLKGNVATLIQEVASLREDMTEVKGCVIRIEETMATKEDLRELENRLMGEIKPLKESVAYLSEQSASHDRKLFLLKNQQQP